MQRTLITKTIFKKENKVVGVMLPDFKTYKVRVPTQSDTDIKIDLQFNGIESRNTFIICGQLIFKGTKTNQWERNRLFNKWFGGNYIYPHVKK